MCSCCLFDGEVMVASVLRVNVLGSRGIMNCVVEQRRLRIRGTFIWTMGGGDPTTSYPE